MKIIFAALRWDYKDPQRGPSFEYMNLWDSLRHLTGTEVELFPFDEIESSIGRKRMNDALVARVSETHPDLVFFFLYEDEFAPDTIARVSTMTTTLNWFADDHWRFDSFSRRYATLFSWVATTDFESVSRYRKVGQKNVVLTQWGCNHHLYRPLKVDADLQVTFVGQPHGRRAQVLDDITRAGIGVSTWGYGWPEGRLGPDELVDVFNRSKINLNLSNVSSTRSLRTTGRILRATASGGSRRHAVMAAARSLWRGRREQLKARNFEVPGCGGFLLTEKVEELQEYYLPGREVVTFAGVPDLVEKAHYYLSNENERREIAAAGLQRTLKDHTYERRFTELFEKIGLA